MTWHPILGAVEVEPAHWVMIDTLDTEYGDVQLRRTPDGLRYRAEYEGELIGWGTTLAGGCMRIHQAYLDAMGPKGWPNNSGTVVARNQSAST